MKDLFCFLILAMALLITGAGAETVSVGIAAVGGGDPGTPPQDAGAFAADAQAAVAEGDWPDVLSITTRGLAYFPNDAELHCLQGYSFRKLGQYQKAVDAVSVAIPLDPRPVRYANRGYAYLALGNYSAALADADEGIRIDPAYASSYSVRALALHGMGRDSEALTAVGTAIDKEPGSAHALAVRGIILAAQGDCEGAAASFTASRALDPAYSLPWPGFPSAEQSLKTLDASCRQTPATPTQSPVGFIPVVAALGAAVVIGTRR